MLRLVRRLPRWLAAAAVVLAMVGCFLAWGPVGLGNGPLWLPSEGGGGWGKSESQVESVAYVVPIGNAGPGAAVIDGVAVTGSAGSASPILRHALTGHSVGYDCYTLGTFSGRTSALPGCVQPLLTSATGTVVPVGTGPDSRYGRKNQPTLVLELAGPGPGRCWKFTSVVVHYHIGIRHYVATFPQGNVATCGAGRNVADLTLRIPLSRAGPGRGGRVPSGAPRS